MFYAEDTQRPALYIKLMIRVKTYGGYPFVGISSPKTSGGGPKTSGGALVEDVAPVV